MSANYGITVLLKTNKKYCKIWLLLLRECLLADIPWPQTAVYNDPVFKYYICIPIHVNNLVYGLQKHSIPGI